MNPYSFDWRDDSLKGRRWEETALYELHVGTFGPEGTFDGVEKRLGHLADLGVAAIEFIPLSDSPGRRNRRAYCQPAPCSTASPRPC